VFRNMQLRPNQTLAQAGVVSGDTIGIFLNTRGGRQPLNSGNRIVVGYCS